MTPLLELRGVSKEFRRGLLRPRKTVALDDVSLVVPRSPALIIAIAGESGSGKTTLARVLLGIERISVGQALYCGSDMNSLSSGERRQLRRDVQPIFQDPFESYNPFYRVDHVLTTPMRKLGLAPSRKEARARIREAVEQVGLRPDEILGRYPHELSGGQRQRLMVARTLLIRPRVILADEPVSMVDASLRATVLESLRTLNRDHGISLIYVTHDLTTAYQISDVIVVLYRGRIVEAGPAESVIRAPRHPYTQLLVASIPQPDPDRRWSPARPRPDPGPRTNRGCNFADRCSAAMPRCLHDAPPLFMGDEPWATRCFLAADDPTASTAEVAHTLVSAEPRRMS